MFTKTEQGMFFYVASAVGSVAPGDGSSETGHTKQIVHVENEAL